MLESLVPPWCCDYTARASLPRTKTDRGAGLSSCRVTSDAGQGCVIGVTEPANVEVPAPIATRMQVWPDVWHWLESGTSETNASVFEWSVEPPW